MVESNAAKSASTYAKSAAVLASVAIVAPFIAPAFYAQDVQNVLTEEQIDVAVQKAIALQDLSCDVNLTDGPKTIAIYEEIFEEDAYESYSQVLAEDELDSKDFKESVRDLLNANASGQNVESYRDIKDAKVKDVDVTKSGDNGIVEIEFKVDFYNDGDDEDGDAETAKILVTFNIKDSYNDEDDDREDAEVEAYDDADFELVKIYN